MPQAAPRSSSAIPAQATDWRPQQFGRHFRRIRDPLVEPGWGGVHVLAHLRGGKVTFIDEEGVDCTGEFGEVAESLAASALSDDLVADGFLTVEPTQPTEGVAVARTEAPGAAEIMGQMFVGSRAAPKASRRRRLDPTVPVALVLVDLLRIDGSDLFDVPLLERKRLLDGAIETGALIRLTPFVREPIGTFVTTWRGMGFLELVYKDPNSRYLPGTRNEDWATAPMPIK
jgi:bifunctional non-homologous end joining protein LigD